MGARMARGDGRIDDRRRGWIATALTALVLAVLAQLVRVFMPLGFEIGEQIGGAGGYLMAGAVALAVFASPALAAIGGFAGRGRVSLVGSVVSLSIARLAIQVVHPIPVWLGVAAVAVGLAALPAIVGSVRRTAGDAALLVGVLLGLCLDTAIRTAFLTWDPAWHDGVAPLLLAILLAASAVAAATLLSAVAGPTAAPPALRLAAFGPFLALQLLFLQSPAAVAAHGELSMAAAAAVILAADAAALFVGSLRPRIGPVLAVALAVLAAAGASFLRDATGVSAIALFAAEQVALVLLLGRALIDEPLRPERPRRLAGVCALGSLAFAGIVFAYQVNNEVPLPFPVALVPAIAAAAVGVAAIPRRGTVPARVPRAAIAVPIALLSVPAIVGVSAPALVSDPGDGTVRVVSYNIHGGVNVDGALDPETIARVIEDQDPDVVVLNEVSRGWPIFGGIDAAEWLSRRLEMPYVYEPAADPQFGNAILSRLPILEATGGALPFGEGPQQRSYIMTRLDTGNGRDLTVIGTHLQESAGDPATRTNQIDTLLDVWGGASPAVVAGDMNLQPDEEDVQRFLDAGLVSVQDEIGDPCEPTAFEPEPDKPCDRPDWVFATPDLDPSEFLIVRTPASDHLPIAVAFTLP